MLGCVTLFLLLTTASATAIPNNGNSGNPKPTTCTVVGPSATDMFDSVSVVPALPEINGVITPPTPTGAYLTYSDFTYANIGSLSNVQPPSKPNDIYISGGTTGYITPAFKGANTFSLSNIRYACVARTAASVLEVPPRCDFSVTCQVFGGGVRTRSFTFVPGSLTPSFNTGAFTPDFKDLTQCAVTLTDITVAGVVLSGPAANLGVLLLDNVVNQGEKCWQ